VREGEEFVSNSMSNLRLIKFFLNHITDPNLQAATEDKIVDTM